MIRSILLFLLLIELSPARARGFGQTERAVPNLPIRRGDTAELPCRQKAEKLLDETLNFMEKNYYRRAQVAGTGGRRKSPSSGSRQLRGCLCMYQLVFSSIERTP